MWCVKLLIIIKMTGGGGYSGKIHYVCSAPSYIAWYNVIHCPWMASYSSLKSIQLDKQWRGRMREFEYGHWRDEECRVITVSDPVLRWMAIVLICAGCSGVSKEFPFLRRMGDNEEQFFHLAEGMVDFILKYWLWVPCRAPEWMCR